MRPITRLFFVLLTALLLTSSSATAQSEQTPRPTDANLSQQTTSEWLTNGGGLSNSRYSTLDQIAITNIASLRGAWFSRLNSGRGAQYRLEAEPIVVDGVMYISTGSDDIFALDAVSGRKLWQYQAQLTNSITTLCCGWTNRGVAVGDGLVFAGLLDGSFIALDQQSGALVWKDDLESWQQGYSISSAPRYYDGLVYVGMQSSEFGTRGRLYALDARTGRELWRFYTVPAPGDPGGDTWPGGEAYLHGGGDIWQTPAIDPDLGLIYFSTGSAAPHFDGSGRPGDNLFTDSIVALEYRTGQYRWHLQEVHHDIWNYGALSPVVLFESGGHKGIYQCGKTGWCYFLDRTNGQPLIGLAERPVPQESRQSTGATQPYPVGNAAAAQCGEPVPGATLGCIFDPFWDSQLTVRPGAASGGSWAPTAYDPRSNLVFVSSFNRNAAYAARPQAFSPGTRYESGSATPPPGSAYAWTLSAIDAASNAIAWQQAGVGEAPYGALATAGGLVFAGQADGHLVAYNARTGDPLWQFQTGFGITAPPISWSADGVQYITVLAGGNAESGPFTVNGDAVWSFALNGTIDETQSPAPPQSRVGVPAQQEQPAPFIPLSSAG